MTIRRASALTVKPVPNWIYEIGWTMLLTRPLMVAIQAHGWEGEPAAASPAICGGIIQVGYRRTRSCTRRSLLLRRRPFGDRNRNGKYCARL